MLLIRKRRKKIGFKPADYYTIILFLLSFFKTSFARSMAGPVHRLQCMTCRVAASDTTELDQFRVRQGLNEPWCDMEPIECAPQQDTCVTVSMQVGPHSFWIGSGCDQRVNYDIPADRDGCVDLQTFTRIIQYRHSEERPAFQQVCICSDDLCNGTNSKFTIHYFIVLSILLNTILLRIPI